MTEEEGLKADRKTCCQCVQTVGKHSVFNRAKRDCHCQSVSVCNAVTQCGGGGGGGGGGGRGAGGGPGGGLGPVRAPPLAGVVGPIFPAASFQWIWTAQRILQRWRVDVRGDGSWGQGDVLG